MSALQIGQTPGVNAQGEAMDVIWKGRWSAHRLPEQAKARREDRSEPAVAPGLNPATRGSGLQGHTQHLGATSGPEKEIFKASVMQA